MSNWYACRRPVIWSLMMFCAVSALTARAEDPPASAPLPEKRSVVSPLPEKKSGEGAAPATMLPDNCAKGNAAAVPPPGVGSHIIIPPGKAPKAVCDQPSIESEAVWKGQSMTCNYTIRNTGDADLFIRPKAT